MPTAIAEYTPIYKGESGQHVVDLQTKLVSLGYNTNGIDGNYGGGTESAIMSFQANNGLKVTGIADSETLALLYDGSKEAYFGSVSNINHLMAYATDYQNGYTICILDTENELVKAFNTDGSNIISGTFSEQDKSHYVLSFKTAFGNSEERITWNADGTQADFSTSDGTRYKRIYLDEAFTELSRYETIRNPEITKIIKPYVEEGKQYSLLKNISPPSSSISKQPTETSVASTQTLIPTAPSTENNTIPQKSAGQNYVLNTNTHKFHYPSCRSVNQMKPSNRWDYFGTRDEIINMGYVPCKNCNP